MSRYLNDLGEDKRPSRSHPRLTNDMENGAAGGSVRAERRAEALFRQEAVPGEPPLDRSPHTKSLERIPAPRTPRKVRPLVLATVVLAAMVAAAGTAITGGPWAGSP